MQVEDRRAKVRRGARLQARLNRATEALFQKAAKIEGRSVSEFVINSALEAAKRTLQENDLINLTYRDRITFVETLLSPPAPNAKLRRAAQRHALVLED